MNEKSQHVKILINGREIQSSGGETILDIAESNGIRIPSLCKSQGLEHYTSCMLCVVKDDKSGKIIPSCSAYPEEGMMIETDTDEIRELRKTALELLLSEHLGDCEAPCRRACPAFLDIPLMINLINENRLNDAAEVVFRNIPLPSVLGRICPAPCERACRRGKLDSQISICLLKRFVGDYVIENEALIPFESA